MKSLRFSILIWLNVMNISVKEYHCVKAEEFIVFVHGLAGFGRDEMLGLGYWGFPLLTGYNITKEMSEKTGLKTFEASVGPFSSNWDRACELYAQIKGLQTDYGVAHSTTFLHNRMGRDFRLNTTRYNYYKTGGFFPSWNENNRVHLIGHSMGGQTIRYLERLLQLGDADEKAVEATTSNPPMSDLFRGGKNWIASVTTIASPLDGSTLHTVLDSQGLPITNLLKDVLFFVGQASKSASWFSGETSERHLFDFDLDHHPDFTPPQSSKSYQAFQDWTAQIFNSPKWSNGYLDLADYDMSPHKMKLFNAAGPRAFSTTRYFAISTYQTGICTFNWNDQCPNWDINPVMSASASLMGNLDDLFGNNPVQDDWGDRYDDSWEQNDGLVSRRSSRGPTYGVNDGSPAPEPHPTNYWGSYKYDAASLSKGRWYYYDLERDHVQAIGFTLFWAPKFMYQHVADIINGIKYQS